MGLLWRVNEKIHGKHLEQGQADNFSVNGRWRMSLRVSSVRLIRCPFVPRFLILVKWSNSKHLKFGIKEFEQLFTNCVTVDKSQDFPEPVESVGSSPTCPCQFRVLQGYQCYLRSCLHRCREPLLMLLACTTLVHVVLSSQRPAPVLLFLKVSSGHWSPSDPSMWKAGHAEN